MAFEPRRDRVPVAKRLVEQRLAPRDRADGEDPDRDGGDHQRGARAVVGEVADDLLPADAIHSRRRPCAGASGRASGWEAAQTSSGTRRPSTIWMVRRVNAARSLSWVTMTTVLPSSTRRPNRLKTASAVATVEVARRLVGDEQRRIVRERARDRDALLLAARRSRRQLVGLVGHPDFVEQRHRARRSARADVPRPAKSIGSITFSTTVSVGRSWKNWNTTPTVRAAPARDLALGELRRGRCRRPRPRPRSAGRCP